MAYKIQLRRDTAANWISVDPVLAAGEVGVDLDTLKIKVGNGTLRWTELDYLAGDAEVDLSAYALKDEIPDVSNFITAEDIPTIPVDISDLTDEEGLLGQGSGGEPSQISNGSWTVRLESNGNLEFVNPGEDILFGSINPYAVEDRIDGIKINNFTFLLNESKLIVPEGGDIVDNQGNSVLGGGSADTGDVKFEESEVYTETGRMTFYVSGAGEGEKNRIDFEADSFTVDVEQDINLVAGTDLELVTNNRGGGSRTWTFKEDGNLQLPTNGDIVDSNGNSVLGSSANTGNISFEETTISAPDGANIIIDGRSEGVTTARLEINPEYALAKLEAKAANSKMFYSGEFGDFTSAVWEGYEAFGQQRSRITFTGAGNLYDFLSNDREYSIAISDENVEWTPDGDTFYPWPNGMGWNEGTQTLTVEFYDSEVVPQPEEPVTLDNLFLRWVNTSKVSVDHDDYEEIEIKGVGIGVKIESTRSVNVEASDGINIQAQNNLNLETVNGDVRIRTNAYSNTREWTFGSDGVTYLPGATVQEAVSATYADEPVALDITKSVHKLANGEYSLADGQEGQIIYIVPQTGATPLGVELYITRARVVSNSYSEIINDGLFLPFSGSVNNNLRNVVTLIFTDGAWNLSGGEWD